jgi:hypothetical protein
MGENLPYISYLSPKEHSFIKKFNFGDDLKLFKKTFWRASARGLWPL